VPKMKDNMRGNRRYGLRELPRPPQRRRGRRPRPSWSPQEKEGEIISSPHSLPPKILPSPGDLFGQ
jgi:hypothetical protein